MYLHFYFLTVLDLHCCKGFFSSCSKWGLLSSCDCRLLTVGAFLVAEPRFQSVWASVVAAPGLQSTGSIVVRHRLSCSTACHPRGRELNPYFLCWLVDSLPLSHKRSPGVGPHHTACGILPEIPIQGSLVQISCTRDWTCAPCIGSTKS